MQVGRIRMQQLCSAMLPWLRIAAAGILLAFTAPLRAAQPIDVHIGIGLTKPPYIMSSGKSGLEYEIADRALAAAGYRMVAQSLPPARALALLRAGHLDGVLTVDDGIGGNDYFSDVYLHYQNVAVTLAARHIRLRDTGDLPAYSIAAFQNARLILGNAFQEAVAGHPAYSEHSQQITQNRLLYAGRVDVVVGDRLIFRYLARQLGAPLDATQEVVFHPLFPPSPRKAVFRSVVVRDHFNAGLKTIRGNGTYAAILKKYQQFTEQQ